LFSLSLTWFGILALAGIIHFIIGRMLFFTSLRLVGATRAVPVISCSILISALIGTFFLSEPLTLLLAIAILLIVGGIMLVSSGGNSDGEQKGVVGGSLAIGILTALGGALCWGVSPVLMKIGLKEIGSPLLALVVAYGVSSLIVAFSLFCSTNKKKMHKMDSTAIILLVLAVITTSAGMALRMLALDYSPVSVVEPLIGSTHNLFIIPVSFLINRRIEAFELRIAIGTIAIMIGIILII
jgi:drug/metabolite transporter (DMT)-like permease